MKKLFGFLREKFYRRLARLRELRFNNSRYDRNESREKQEVNIFPSGVDYWPAVAKKILQASNDTHFFLNQAVILHLASENSTLGYRLLKKIQDHPRGYELLNKNQTPSWGSPFLLEKYPFLSPTTASHIANLLSITDAFGGEQSSSFIDFGGGMADWLVV